ILVSWETLATLAWDAGEPSHVVHLACRVHLQLWSPRATSPLDPNAATSSDTMPSGSLLDARIGQAATRPGAGGGSAQGNPSAWSLSPSTELPGESKPCWHAQAPPR